jgi:hypothetical protein
MKTYYYMDNEGFIHAFTLPSSTVDICTFYHVELMGWQKLEVIA